MQARESNERKTTLEKNLLRVNLESLPEEKMHNNVRKRNGSPHLVGGEGEIDEMTWMSRLDTQWELYRSVNKSNKNRRDECDVLMKWTTESKNPNKNTTLA
uniref:Uncharacterized protein n=1 Tax=Oryza barthii TaxID=65489 RepID=A0A0D3G0J6_9ORYZ